jgi:hypothetical protein
VGVVGGIGMEIAKMTFGEEIEWKTAYREKK